MGRGFLPSSLAQRILGSLRTRDDDDILFVHTGTSLLANRIPNEKENKEIYRLGLEVPPSLYSARRDECNFCNERTQPFPFHERYVSKTIWTQFTYLFQRKIIRTEEERLGAGGVTKKCAHCVDTNFIVRNATTFPTSLTGSLEVGYSSLSTVFPHDFNGVTKPNTVLDIGSILVVLCCQETFFACITEASCLLLSIPFCVLNPNDPVKRREEILKRLRTVELPEQLKEKEASKNSSFEMGKTEVEELCRDISDSERSLIILRDKDIHFLLCEAERFCRKVNGSENQPLERKTKALKRESEEPPNQNMLSAYPSHQKLVSNKLEDLMYWNGTLFCHGGQTCQFSEILTEVEVKGNKYDHGANDFREMKKNGKRSNYEIGENTQKKESVPDDKDEVAYIMFTSGSSGPRPKGVMNTIGNLTAYYDGFCCPEEGLQILKKRVCCKMAAYGNDADSFELRPTLCDSYFPVFLTLSTPFFDPSIGDMICTLLTPRPWRAAQICMSSESLLEPSLINHLVRVIFHPCRRHLPHPYLQDAESLSLFLVPTHIISTPAVWQLLTNDTAELLRQWLSHPTSDSYGGMMGSGEKGTGAVVIQEVEQALCNPPSPSSLCLSQPSRCGTLSSSLCLFLGGEKIPASIIDRWASITSLYSIYGVTEATIYQAVSPRVLPSQGAHDIGYTFFGWNYLQLDVASDRDSPDYQKNASAIPRASLIKGERIGEIILCGPQVALGYLPDSSNQDECSGSTSPFFTCSQCGKQGFRTGDIGALQCVNHKKNSTHSNRIHFSGSSSCTDGGPYEVREVRCENDHLYPFSCSARAFSPLQVSYRVAVLGRKDFQIKINGQRVSVEEVEGSLQTLFKNVFCCFCGFGVPTETSIEMKNDDVSRATPQVILCMYAALRHTTKLSKLSTIGSSPNIEEVQKKEREEAELLDRLSSVWESLASTVLPPHMVPRCWLVEKTKTNIPLTPTGKIHRIAIAEKWKKRNRQMSESYRKYGNAKLLEAGNLPQDKKQAVESPTKLTQQRAPRRLSLVESTATPSTVVGIGSITPSPLSYNVVYNVVQKVWQKSFGLSSHSCNTKRSSVDSDSTQDGQEYLLAPYTNFYHFGGDSLGALKITREVYMRLGGTEEGIDRFGHLPPPFQPLVLLQNPRLADYVERVVRMLEDEEQNQKYSESSACLTDTKKVFEVNCTLPFKHTLNNTEEFDAKHREEEDASNLLMIKNTENSLPPASSSGWPLPCLSPDMKDATRERLRNDAFSSPPDSSSLISGASSGGYEDSLLVTSEEPREMRSPSTLLSEDSFQAVLELGDPFLLSLILRERLYDLSILDPRDKVGKSQLLGSIPRFRVVRSAPTPLHTLVNLYYIALANESEEESKGNKCCSLMLWPNESEAERKYSCFSCSSSSAFMDSLSHQYLEMMTVLVKEFGIKATATTPDGVTPAHLAAAGSKHSPLPSLLPLLSFCCSACREKANPGQNEGWHDSCKGSALDFPSHCVAFSQCKSTAPLKLLVASGSPLSVRDRRGQTLLHFAARAGHVEAVGFILWSCRGSSSKSSSREDNSAHVNIYSLLCERDKWQRTPAHWAALNGHLGVLQLMLLAFQYEEESEGNEKDYKGEGNPEKSVVYKVQGKKWKPNRKKVLSPKSHFAKQARKRTHLAYETIIDIAERVYCCDNDEKENGKYGSSIPPTVVPNEEEDESERTLGANNQGKLLNTHDRSIFRQVCKELAYWIEAA